jgi:hypothetical protein
MAIAVVMDFAGATLDQYDRVIEKMALKQGGPMPEGGVSHWVTGTDEGIRVTDVWQSREQFDRFAQEQIGPFTREVGITEQPRMSFFDVHNYLTAPPG